MQPVRRSMKHNALSRRLEALESEMPSLEELEARRQRELLSKCTTDELRRLGVIIERIDGDRDKLTTEEITFLEGLEAKYGSIHETAQ